MQGSTQRERDMAAQQSHGAPQGATRVLARPGLGGESTTCSDPSAGRGGPAAGRGKWSAAAGPEPAAVPS
eukprot:3884476-Lingulodinium_polyedra.AAC.1